MENKELLFNLIKKLEGGELTLKEEGNEIFLVDPNSANSDKNHISLCELQLETDSHPMAYVESITWNMEKNDKFKENFYKEKGLDKCWVRDCLNKIYQKEGDYKKVKIPCQDKHTRMVCLECSKKVIYGL